MRAMLPDVSVHRLKANIDPRGQLAVLELLNAVPFAVRRLFYVSGVPAGAERGGHAHRRCHQFLICQDGQVDVHAFDGQERRVIALAPHEAVLIPAGVFASEVYVNEQARLLVLCDQPYEPDDYIHGEDAFRAFCQERAPVQP